MLRLLSNLATAASLVLTVAVCILWHRSYDQSEKLTWTRDHAMHSLRTAQGSLVFGLYQASFPILADAPRGLKFERDLPASAQLEMMTVLLLCSDASARTTYWNRGGFGWSHRRSSRDLIV